MMPLARRAAQRTWSMASPGARDDNVGPQQHRCAICVGAAAGGRLAAGTWLLFELLNEMDGLAGDCDDFRPDHQSTGPARISVGRALWSDRSVRRPLRRALRGVRRR